MNVSSAKYFHWHQWLNKHTKNWAIVNSRRFNTCRYLTKKGDSVSVDDGKTSLRKIIFACMYKGISKANLLRVKNYPLNIVSNMVISPAMKAARIHQFGDAEVFKTEDILVPGPKENQLLVKNYFSSINPIDFKQRKGNHRYILGAPFPIILGYDAAGIVEKVGKKVTMFQPGDRVCGVLNNKYGGAYAEFVLGTESCFAKLPDCVSLEAGAAIPLAGLTALQALRDKLKLKAGQTILVNGAAGGVGHFAIQLACKMDAHTIAVTSERHFKMIKSYKPDEIIDYQKTDLLAYTKKVDVFFDAVGRYSYPKCRHLLNDKGTYFTTLPRPKLLAHKALALFSKGHKVKTHLMKHNSSDLTELITSIKKNELVPKIDTIFNLDNIADAHVYAQQGHTEGKIVIRIQ